MKRVFRGLTAAIALLMGSNAQLCGGVITNGVLTTNVRDDNGAIDSAVFQGVDFFGQGAHVSDFGFQNGSNASTFLLNNTAGLTQQPVVVGGNIVTGTFTSGGANVSFQREYSLVTGFNVLRVTTEFSNNAGAVLLTYFDTFDPDQGASLGQGFGTFNDVVGIAGGVGGQARIDSGGFEHTVIAGSTDPRAIVASGNPFRIGNGSVLNGFVSSPFDGNDLFADSGTHIGLQTFLLHGTSTSFTYDLAFGLTPGLAQDAFTQANLAPAVPEPSSLALLATGALGLIGYRRRRKQAAPSVAER